MPCCCMGANIPTTETITMIAHNVGTKSRQTKKFNLKGEIGIEKVAN